MKYVTVLLTLALMAGCKMAPPPEQVTTVPLDRLFGFTKRSDVHLVILTETSLESDCAIRISIDQKPTADFFGAEIAHFGLTFGSHTLSARTKEGCSKQWTQEIRVSVKAGDVLIMRIDKASLIRTKL